jgi:hypothetical protein
MVRCNTASRKRTPGKICVKREQQEQQRKAEVKLSQRRRRL